MARREEIQQAIQTDMFETFHKQVAYEFGFEQGAEWADKTMLDKACEWLRKSTILADTTIERFKKAMEEQ